LTLTTSLYSIIFDLITCFVNKKVLIVYIARETKNSLKKLIYILEKKFILLCKNIAIATLYCLRNIQYLDTINKFRRDNIFYL